MIKHHQYIAREKKKVKKRKYRLKFVIKRIRISIVEMVSPTKYLFFSVCYFNKLNSGSETEQAHSRINRLVTY